MNKIEQGIELIHEANRIVFLTGAGVSVPSGIPDYRSMDGVYQGIDRPEYLLSYECFIKEPDKFYKFVRQLYHPQAKPNVIHKKIREMEVKNAQQAVITQNIDELHQKAGSENVINFHGSLYECYCSKCQKEVTAEAYMNSDIHQGCGGRIRPNVVLYGEGIDTVAINYSVEQVSLADLIVIAGTSYQVHPFSDLIYYKNKNSQVLVINKEAIPLIVPHMMLEMDATEFFEKI